MDKPFLFLENLLEILPLCLSEDEEINILGKEMLDTYDCCLFPVTMYILFEQHEKFPPQIFHSSKSEEKFLGKIGCNAFKRENYFALGWKPEEPFYVVWWLDPKEVLKQRLELFK